MSLFQQLFTTIFSFVLDGSISGYVDYVFFKLSGDIYTLSIIYSIDTRSVGQNYEITVSVFQNRNKVMEEKRSRHIPKNTLYMVDSYELLARSGSYDVVFEIRSGDKHSKASFSIDIPNYDYLNTSSIVLVSKFYEDTSQAPYRRLDVGFLPNPSAVFKDTLGYYFEIYDVDTGSKLVVKTYITQDGKLKFSSTPKVIRMSMESTYYKGRLPLNKLSDGEYEINFEIVDITKAVKRTLRKSFLVMKQPLKDEIRYFIDYLATPEQLKEFRSIKDQAMKERWIERFWKQYDPDGTFYPVFRQRVIEADAKFSTPFKKGRYTDMGRIYILFGQPDEIRREEIDVTQKSYVIWIYYSGNRRFVFYDHLNTGEYKLVSSNVPGFGVYREHIDVNRIGDRE